MARNISLNEKVCADVEEIVSNSNYRSIAEFFNDAGRRRLEELKKEENNGE